MSETYRFRFGEISPKLVSIEKGLARATERCRNGGELLKCCV